MPYTATTPRGNRLQVRPLHPLLLLLGLGHRLSPIGLGRVVTLTDPDHPPRPPFYTGDGPSAGWVCPETIEVWAQHDWEYRHARTPGNWPRENVDYFAAVDVQEAGGWWLARRWHWRLCRPFLVLAWRYRWGGFQDLPGWLWWTCLVVWAALVWGVPVALLWRIAG